MERCALNRGSTRQIGRAAAPGPLSVCGPGGPQRMAKKHSGMRGRRAPKTVLRLPDRHRARRLIEPVRVQVADDPQALLVQGSAVPPFLEHRFKILYE